MDPITLHFNIFQAGASAEARQSLRVEDPHGKTVGSLKQQLFPGALQEQRSVRFIWGGRVLKDAAVLEQCGLGSEAFIHVSIGESGAAQAEAAAAPRSSGMEEAGGHEAKGSPGRGGHEESHLAPCFLLGAIFFAGTGVLLQTAWRKRWHLSMHASQLLCILAAIWVYLLLFHGLPALFRLLVQGLGMLSPSPGAEVTVAAPSGGVRGTMTPPGGLCPSARETAQLPPLVAGVNTPGGPSS